jgi:hypothetical protein
MLVDMFLELSPVSNKYTTNSQTIVIKNILQYTDANDANEVKAITAYINDTDNLITNIQNKHFLIPIKLNKERYEYWKDMKVKEWLQIDGSGYKSTSNKNFGNGMQFI